MTPQAYPEKSSKKIFTKGKRNLNLYVNDVLNSIRLIEVYSRGLTVEKLKQNIRNQDAIVRRLEVIGEAINALSRNLSKKYPEVQWDNYVGIRNFLIHIYFGLNYKKLLGIIKQDIPKLKKQMMIIKKDLEGQNEK